MSGTIRTTCPACGASNRIAVSFPAHNRGFDTKEYDCPVCGEHLTVADLHKYNEDGTIKEAAQSGEKRRSRT